ncbi:MAG: PQQ-dependent sugar dehydrogenase [Actinomycetota bacterium]
MRLSARLVFVALIAGAGIVAAGCTTVSESDVAATDPSTQVTSTIEETATVTSTQTTTTHEPVVTDSTLPATTTSRAPEPPSLVLVEVGSGFDSPVLLMAHPGGGADLVVEQSGRIVRNDPDHSVVLDITDDVLFKGEQGLLGVAFHPRFTDVSLAYVNYVDETGRTVIEEFAVVEGVFDRASRRVILEVGQPAANHNGGMVAFGPDGYLWIGMGDGGGANDRFGQAQDAETLLGAMLRIDIDEQEDRAYGIPRDNPFANGVGGAPEVWATGLRNPWRFAFDGDDLWIADVGQNEIEEINAVEASDAGLNYGWPIMEGTTCFGGEGCDPTPFVAPLVEYDHDEGCSVTGGYVYRGGAIPELDGQYFYSDFCSGFLRSTALDGTVTDWTNQTGETSRVTGFGVGGDGELYVVAQGGAVFRVENDQ